VAAYAAFELGDALAGDVLAWDRAGRWVAGGTLVVAAACELTPLKDACLSKWRNPIGFLATSGAS
jgi:predicted metal-binding membrane protein